MRLGFTKTKIQEIKIAVRVDGGQNIGMSQDFKITVVTGPFSRNIAEIEKTAEEMDKEIELIYDSPKMSEEMLDSDLVITGGGTTLYELAARGTPALGFCPADNQYRNTKGVAEVSVLIDISWGHRWRGEKFYKATNELINNYLLRAKVSKVGQELVDGKGSPRCAQEILDLYSSEV